MATVNDDAASPATPGQNQSPNVVAQTGLPTDVSASGSGQGSSASPGPSGKGGTNSLPGRRTYNPLSKLASHNYILSLYQVSPDAYQAFVETGRRKIDALAAFPQSQAPQAGTGPGAFLIAQSGGINSTTQSRAPGFDLDLYIDSFSYTVATSSNESGAPAFISLSKMTIIEPYGFSFLSNLKRCLEGLQAYSKTTAYKDNSNALKQFFVLGIKFYGYDNNGNLIKGSDIINGSPLDPGNDTTNLFENFYDLELINFKFQLIGTSTTYNIEFSTPGTMTNLGIKRGRLINGARCVGNTVEEMLTGPQGLLTTLNKEQEKQQNKNPQDRKIANKWTIEFIGEAKQRIQKAATVTPADLDKIKWPGSGAKNISESTDATSTTTTPDSTSRDIAFRSDTSIIQAISSIIQQSEFMINALKTVYTNVVEPDTQQKNVKQVTNPEPQTLSWFNISVALEDISWDDQLKDWAYTTKYLVTLCDVPSINTPFSTNLTKYYGPHKYYNYYLTGQNTEVIDYTITFNLAYHNTVLATVPNSQNITPAPGSNAGQTSTTPGQRSPSDTTGAKNTGLEAQASVVTALTSPDAYVQGKISILGDPDFLVRDQVTGVISLYEKFYDTSLFTVSAHGGQVFIEIILKEAQDYKHKVGLLEVNQSIQFFPYPKHVQDVAKGIIYQVQSVTANFQQGKFLMTLDIRGAQTWADDPADPQRSAGREAENNNATLPAGSTSGPSTGPGVSTSANTGQRQDPAPPKQEVAGPGIAQSNNDTVGNFNNTADDDSQPTPTVSPANKQEQNAGRYDFDGTTWYDSNGNPLPEPPIYG